MLAHAFSWSKTIKNTWKWVKKVPFSSCVREAHVRLTKKNDPNEQTVFGCQPAFGSHSQSLTNKLFSSFFFVSLSCAWWKRCFFIHFWMFLTMRVHVQACASMPSLVEIHNTPCCFELAKREKHFCLISFLSISKWGKIISNNASQSLQQRPVFTGSKTSLTQVLIH